MKYFQWRQFVNLLMVALMLLVGCLLLIEKFRPSPRRCLAKFGSQPFVVRLWQAMLVGLLTGALLSSHCTFFQKSYSRSTKNHSVDNLSCLVGLILFLASTIASWSFWLREVSSFSLNALFGILDTVVICVALLLVNLHFPVCLCFLFEGGGGMFCLLCRKLLLVGWSFLGLIPFAYFLLCWFGVRGLGLLSFAGATCRGLGCLGTVSTKRVFGHLGFEGLIFC